MEKDFYEQERMREQGLAGESLGRFTAKTFVMMFLGLLVTFGVATVWYLTDMTWYAYRTIPYFSIIMLVAELAVVIGMSHMIHKISVGTAAAFFFIYAALSGVTFSTYLYIYELGSFLLIFAATALYFGGMAVFGYFTNIDLSRIRTVLVGGLIFLIVANVLMLFIPGLAVMDQVVCSIGVVVFLAFTAYDTQKLKAMYQYYSADGAMLKRASIIAALQLYLDFINLFLYLLRLFGRRKN